MGGSGSVNTLGVGCRAPFEEQGRETFFEGRWRHFAGSEGFFQEGWVTGKEVGTGGEGCYPTDCEPHQEADAAADELVFAPSCSQTVSTLFDPVARNPQSRLHHNSNILPPSRHSGL